MAAREPKRSTVQRSTSWGERPSYFCAISVISPPFRRICCVIVSPSFLSVLALGHHCVLRQRLVFVTDYAKGSAASIASPWGNKAAHLSRSEAMAEVTKVFACRASCPKGAQQR